MTRQWQVIPLPATAGHITVILQSKGFFLPLKNNLIKLLVKIKFVIAMVSVFLASSEPTFPISLFGF